MLRNRDAAHGHLIDLLERDEPLLENLTNRFIYYVRPVDAIRDEDINPAGPTIATRMDKFSDQLFAATELLRMIGKAECGDVAIKAIAKNQAESLIAVGGAAFLIAKSVSGANRLAFEELNMGAIYEFEVSDKPVPVAVDSHGESPHRKGPQK